MHHVLYHANCADGFAAACIARHALQATGIVNLQPVNYGQPDQMPLGKDGILFPGDTLTYLDYTPPQDVLDAFYDDPGNSMIPLTIIDHHSTAAERHGIDKDTGLSMEAPCRFTSVFSLTMSGAALAWLHYNFGKVIPQAVKLIEYRDLGHAFDPANAEDPRTADALNLHAYLFRCIPRSFAAWTPLLLENGMVDTLVRQAIQTGARLRAADRAIILSACATPHWLNFNGEEIPAVNGLDAGLISDACTELLRAYPTAPFAASWFINPTSGHAVYSLRSRRGSAVNVAEIAATMAPGGGGHPNAAGFSTLTPVPFV